MSEARRLTPFVRHRLKEQQDHMQCNGSPDATLEDAYEALMQECGMRADGYCGKAGSEECDWECPFSR